MARINPNEVAGFLIGGDVEKACSIEFSNEFDAKKFRDLLHAAYALGFDDGYDQCNDGA